MMIIIIDGRPVTRSAKHITALEHCDLPHLPYLN